MKSLCDAHSDSFGCDSRGERGWDGRQAQLHGEKSWYHAVGLTSNPNSAYEVTAGQGIAEYSPGGSFMNIYVNVLNMTGYTGAMMHAVDASGQNVGSWSIPGPGITPFSQHPLQCGEHFILHTTAEEKPRSMEFSFKTPPVGTGTITFRTLFKKGPANEGEFHRPETDLVLSEGGAAQASQWRLAEPGESCNEVCKDHGLVCKDNTLVSNVPKSETEARQFLAHLYPCSLYLGDCGIGFPGGSAAGDLKCWYHNEDTCRISENKGAKNVRCGAVSHLVRRFCYCESPQRRHLAGEQSDHRASNAVDSTAAAAAAAAAASAVTAVDDEDDGDDGAHKHEHFSEVSLAKPRTAPGILVAAIVPMIALLLSFKSGSQDYRIRSIVVLAAICATSSVKMCHAHNWLAQIGGRGKGAGTLCPKRLARSSPGWPGSTL